MVRCEHCGNTKFHREFIVTIMKDELRQSKRYELPYDSGTELLYICTICGVEYEGLAPIGE